MNHTNPTKMESTGVQGDKYRPLLQEDLQKNIKWRFGSPPNYEIVNKLFEEGRTKVWYLISPSDSATIYACVFKQLNE